MNRTLGRLSTWQLRSIGPTIAALAFLTAPACQMPGMLDDDRDWIEPDSRATPSWQHQPHSWRKLDAIQDWLVSAGALRQPELVALAELELAEGRLRFARSERERTSAADQERRLSSASTGFRRVLNDPLAERTLLERARAGLASLTELRGPQAVAARAPRRAPSRATGILERSAWGARAAVPGRLTSHGGRYSRVTVHHSANHTSELGHETPAEVNDAIRRMQRFHMESRRFGDIGYHFLIDPTGRVLEGRSLRYQGAHCGGKGNIGNIGVCLMGHFNKEHPEPAQIDALERLTGKLRKQFGIARRQVFGHKELVATACPGSGLMRWVDGYRRAH